MAKHTRKWIAGAFAWFLTAAIGLGQYRTVGVPVTSMDAPSAAPEEMTASVISAVSFIDSAMPRTMVRTRGDFAYRNHRPVRSEYLFRKTALEFPESNIDAIDWSTYGEFGLNPWFSLFVEQPMRWINPDFNDNTYGVGDLAFGLKFAFYDTNNFLNMGQDFLATFQLRSTAPTHQSAILGNDWTLEPGLLVNYRAFEYLTLEGEVRYWMPFSNNDFAGQVLRYGLGFTYGQRYPDEITVVPVAEVVGWTALGGKSEIVGPAGVNTIDANGQTIINGQLGVRWCFGNAGDIYMGYSRALTGQQWYQDLFRVEFRLIY